MTRSELIKRLESATGPSRELDAEIAVLIHGRHMSGDGAVLTDKYGPSEHVARMRGDTKALERIAQAREVRAS